MPDSRQRDPRTTRELHHAYVASLTHDDLYRQPAVFKEATGNSGLIWSVLAPAAYHDLEDVDTLIA